MYGYDKQKMAKSTYKRKKYGFVMDENTRQSLLKHVWKYINHKTRYSEEKKLFYDRVTKTETVASSFSKLQDGVR